MEMVFMVSAAASFTHGHFSPQPVTETSFGVGRNSHSLAQQQGGKLQYGACICTRHRAQCFDIVTETNSTIYEC
jgi:hypothetical protein